MNYAATSDSCDPPVLIVARTKDDCLSRCHSSLLPKISRSSFCVALSPSLSEHMYMSVPQLATSATYPFSASLSQKKPVSPVATAHRCLQNSFALSLFRSLSTYIYIYMPQLSTPATYPFTVSLARKKSFFPFANPHCGQDKSPTSLKTAPTPNWAQCLAQKSLDAKPLYVTSA